MFAFGCYSEEFFEFLLIRLFSLLFYISSNDPPGQFRNGHFLLLSLKDEFSLLLFRDTDDELCHTHYILHIRRSVVKAIDKTHCGLYKLP